MPREPEQRFEVETPLGPLWFWGRDTGLPVLVMIGGTFANFTALEGLQWAMEGLDVWRGHLPGNHTPRLAATSVGAFSAAYSHAIARRLADRPVVVLGLSVGGVVAMGLTAPNIRRVVVVEPLLSTRGVWPVRIIRDQAPPGQEDFLWNILGAAADRIEPRDYFGVLNGLATPTAALLGGIPLLPERNFVEMPSLITPEVRARLDAHPRVQVIDAPAAGHNVPKLATDLFINTVFASCVKGLGPGVRVAEDRQHETKDA